jgi:MFS transporter, MHS family, shikimate and dehydroshikimate transport protein
MGRRIPFLLSAVLVGVGLYVRLRLDESPEFLAHRDAGAIVRLPLAAVLRGHWRAVLLGIGMSLGFIAGGYVTLVFLVGYGVSLGIDRALVLVALLVGCALEIAAVLLAARLADRIGRLRVIVAGAAAGLVAAALLFPLFDTGVPALVVLSVALVRVAAGVGFGPAAALWAELLPATVRYSGASLAFQVASVAGGALAPIIATLLAATSLGSAAVGAYLVAVCAVSLLATLGLARLTRPAARGPWPGPSSPRSGPRAGAPASTRRRSAGTRG